MTKMKSEIKQYTDIINNLKKENEGLMNAGISSTYKVNSLFYNVNLFVS